jgi:hypothetical protein
MASLLTRSLACFGFCGLLFSSLAAAQPSKDLPPPPPLPKDLPPPPAAKDAPATASEKPAPPAPAPAAATSQNSNILVERGNGGQKLFRITEGLVVEGQRQKPNAFYVLQRASTPYDWETLEENFLPRILKAVEKAPF